MSAAEAPTPMVSPIKDTAKVRRRLSLAPSILALAFPSPRPASFRCHLSTIDRRLSSLSRASDEAPSPPPPPRPNPPIPPSISVSATTPPASPR